jgi:iron complex outermembrane recepter protein
VNPNTAVQGAGSYDLVNAFATWSVSSTLSLRAGIDNVFDRQPEIVGREPGFTNAGGQTVPGFYDLLGRRFYVGVKLNF